MARNLLKAVVLLLDEAAVAAIVLLLLPRFGIHLHWGIFAGLMVIMMLLTYVVYKSLTTINRRPPVGGQESLIGARGTVITPLSPEGSVRIAGETWKASALSCEIDAGQEVIVKRCQGLMILVEPVNPGQKG